MAFKATICEADERLFVSQCDSVEVRKERAKPVKPSPAEEIEQWRVRAEDTAHKYQELMQSYRQLKASSKEETEWRQRCTKLLQNALRNCRDLDLVLAAARNTGDSGTDDPARAALIAGIEQVVETQLQQLHGEGMLELIEPQPSELFDASMHEAAGTKAAPELAEGLIAEVKRVGYLCGGRAVRKAQVILAAACGTA